MAEAQQLRADLIAQARADAEHLLQKAKDQIERDTRAALQALRAQIADLVVDAAAKIVESSLTPDAQRKLVEDFIAKLPTTAAS
jgi:F-type H+-transporting ATPase subunit b